MSNESGLVAGTVVHTKKGLLPIQNLKVGDLVLSRKQISDLPQYQKILKIIELPEKLPVIKPLWLSHIICTESQLFWSNEAGWLSADKINDQHRLEFLIPMQHDHCDYGRYDFIYGTREIENVRLCLWATGLNDIAIAPKTNDWTHRGTNQNVDWGYLFYDFSNQHIKQILLDRHDCSDLIYFDFLEFDPKDITIDDLNDYRLLYSNDPLIPQILELMEMLPPNANTQPFYTQIYHIEVENTQSYFVGKQGVWVHQ